MSTFADLVQAAYVADREKRFGDAITHARAALALDATNERANLILAHALDQSGRFLEASAVIVDVLKVNSSRPELMHFQANLLRKAGKSEQALPLAQQFARLRPDAFEAHSHLGILLVELDQVDHAIRCFARAMKLNPTHAQNQYNLARTLAMAGQDSEAHRVLSRLLTDFPEFTLGHVCLGELLLKQGLAHDAIRCGRTALSRDADCVSAHLLVAKALADPSITDEIGVVDEEAEEHVRRAITLDPDSAAAHGMLGFAMQERGEFEQAYDEFETSLRQNPRQGAVAYGLAMCRRFSAENHTVFDWLSGLLSQGGMDPSDRAYVHYALGKIQEERREYQNALKQFDSANALMLELRGHQRPFDRDALERRVTQMIAMFDAEFLSKHRNIGCKSALPLIVVGMMRSGTTLIEQILSSHPQVTGAGELMFWHENSGKLFNVDARQLDEVRAGRVAETYVAQLTELDPLALRISDKMPQNTMYLGLISVLFPEARIIHCRRQPVDTCLSIYATPYAASPDFAHDRGNIVFAYQQYLRLMEHWRSVLPPNRFLEVDYEDLTQDSESVTRRMVEFNGLDWDESCLHHEKNRRVVKTPSRWQVRQPVYRTSISRWKNFEPWLGEFSELLDDQPRTAKAPLPFGS